MSATTKWLAVVAMAGAVLVGTAATAAAADGDEIDRQYRAAAWYFVPTLARWNEELTRAVALAQIKPELVCQSTLPELRYRGQGLVEDLQGTTPVDAMADTHVQLIGTVEELTNIARYACDDASGYTEGLRFETERLTHGRRTLLTWLLSTDEPIQAPARPVVGN